VAATPLLTEEGWLLLYHAARRTGAGTFYYLGLALLDTADSTRVLRRSSEWLLGPGAEYEQSGGGGIVFPCGWIRDSDALRIYYGAADGVVALAHGRVSELLPWRRLSDGSVDGRASPDDRSCSSGSALTRLRNIRQPLCDRRASPPANAANG
jgi:predicted GH43/DUF377 family glycosyl hydrolase